MGSCSDRRGHAQYIFNPIFCWWVELHSLPAVYLGPNYGGGNEDNGDLPQKIPDMYCYSPCPQHCSRPAPTHAFAKDSQTPTGKSPVGSLSFSPWSWCTRFCCPIQESILTSYVSFGCSIVGLKSTSSKRAYAIPRYAAPRAPVPAANHCPPVPTQEMLKYSSISDSVGFLGPGVHSLFEPSEHLWHEWGLILNANLLLLPSCWGFSYAIGCEVLPHRCSSAYLLTGVFLTLAMGYLLRATAPDLGSEVSPPDCSLLQHWAVVYFFCIWFLSVRTYVISISWLLQICCNEHRGGYVFLNSIFLFLGQIFRSGIRRWYGGSIFNFWEASILFSSDCANLNSHQECVELPCWLRC